MPTMKDLATLLGVEMDEEFMLQEGKHDIGTFKVTKDGIELCKENGWYPINVVESICRGKYKIIKLPWKPKFDEAFWAVTPEGNGVYSTRWRGIFGDYVFYAIGNCFKTEEEAKSHKDEIMNKLKSIYENGGKTK